MIYSFRHKGVEAFFLSGKTSGIQARHAKRLRLQLARLHRARGPQDMAAPGWRLHPLKGRLSGQWSVWVDAHWRLTFAFRNDGDAEFVDYQDYH
ncbi:MAG: type II toxin-antitoxin system RelE/ParE family toxin [Lysobacterales bacterium]